MLMEPGWELDQLAHRVIGAAIEVHRNLGPGYLETVYEKALCLELADQQIPYVCQAPVEVLYKGQTVGQGFIDLQVDGKLIVELKAVDRLAPIHQAQVLSYLKATRCKLGLLINFNVRVLKEGIQRIIRSDD